MADCWEPAWAAGLRKLDLNLVWFDLKSVRFGLNSIWIELNLVWRIEFDLIWQIAGSQPGPQDYEVDNHYKVLTPPAKRSTLQGFQDLI